MNDPRQCFLTVCAAYRDEASYLREWIEFHRLVGAERFFLYNNDSADDHLRILEPYLADGTVVLHHRPGPVQQALAFNDCLQRHGKESHWIAFIDLDEFLFCPSGEPVPAILRDYEQWPAVCVNQAAFGTSGHRRRPPGLVTESYLYRIQNPGLKHVKCVVDPLRTKLCYGAHQYLYRDRHAVDELERPIVHTETSSLTFDRLRINHYFTKSEEELRRKWLMPLGDRPGKRPPERIKKALVNFAPSAPRMVRDETILQYLPALRKALAETAATSL